VPKDLADLIQRHPGAHHLTSQGVSQPVRPGRLQPCPDAGAAHDQGYPTAGQASPWRGRPQEHLAPGGIRAGVTQVAGDRLSDIDRQREPVHATGFAVHHDLPSPPVQILQAQRRHLTGTQPQT
jgi:hypothetical protein